MSFLFAVLCKKLQLGGDNPFLVMLAASGLLSGYAINFGLLSAGVDLPVANSMLFVSAGLGFQRMQRGDPGGVILLMMFGGIIFGNALVRWIPAPEQRGEDAEPINDEEDPNL